MTKDNSTGKNKEFYELGKKMFDRLNPHIAHNPKVVGPVQKAVACVHIKDGCLVGSHRDDSKPFPDGQYGLWPIHTTPPLPVQPEPSSECNPQDLCAGCRCKYGAEPAPLPVLPQRTWVGLTDTERNEIWKKEVGWGDPSHDDEDLMKAIEQALKEKNNG